MYIFTDIIKNSIKNGTYTEELKLAEVTSLLKKAGPINEVNYTPFSLLSNVSKVFERIIFNQISAYFEQRFTGFRTNNNTQHSSLKI